MWCVGVFVWMFMSVGVACGEGGEWLHYCVCMLHTYGVDCRRLKRTGS